MVELAVCSTDRDLGILGEFSTLIHPQRKIGSKVSSIHGITNKMVADAPLFREIAREVYGLIGGTTVVAHNAKFDMGFLRMEFARMGVELPAFFPHCCTLKMARSLKLPIGNLKLSSLCHYFGEEVDSFHDARSDVKALMKVFSHLRKRCSVDLFVEG